MKHAEIVMERILLLEGTPNMSAYFKINIGQNVKQQFQNDLQLELDAVKRLNAGIHTCVAAKDNGSRELLEKILVEEEEHIDHLEAQLHAIERDRHRGLPGRAIEGRRLSSARQGHGRGQLPLHSHPLNASRQCKNPGRQRSDKEENSAGENHMAFNVRSSRPRLSWRAAIPVAILIAAGLAFSAAHAPRPQSRAGEPRRR